MPVATEQSTTAAVDEVRETIGENEEEFYDKPEATQKDMAFLKNVLEDKALTSLVKAHDKLEQDGVEPVASDVTKLATAVVEQLALKYDEDDIAAEVIDIVQDDFLKALMVAHDDIASNRYKEEVEGFSQLEMAPPPTFPGGVQDAIRMVGIRKHADEPLGFTVTVNNKHELVVARIFKDGDVFKQGLLHEGDVIREVNGVEVSTPEQLQEAMRRAVGSVSLKVIPSYKDSTISIKMYMKARFTYDPYRDNLIPCREAGRSFKDGDILEVLNTEDPNWWQGRRVGDNHASAGLIPSQALEERRKAFVKPDFDYTTKNYLCGLGFKVKKKKQMYKASQAGDFDRTDITVYEEVAKMPPFERKTLVLIGAHGVGRRSLKNKLIRRDSSRFGTTIPYTSRQMRDGEENGKGYNFVSRETMDAEIRENQFMEHGEFDRNLYGTKIDSIMKVIRSGKMCVLDVNPQSLKILKTPEFMPFVVFVAAPNVETLKIMNEQAREEDPSTKTLTDRDFQNTVEESSRIERAYRHLFDFSVVNDNLNETFREIAHAIDDLSTASQWVPVTWVY